MIMKLLATALLLSSVQVATAASPKDALTVAMMAPDTRIYAIARYAYPGQRGEAAVYRFEGKRYMVRTQGALNMQNPDPGTVIISVRTDGTTDNASSVQYTDNKLDGIVDRAVDGGLTPVKRDAVVVQREYDDAIAALLRYRQLRVPPAVLQQIDASVTQAFTGR